MSIPTSATGLDEAAALTQRVARLRSALQWAADAIDPSVRDEVTATVDRCEERLALGVDHTVVALAGGTGSGKSSLFNAILGRDFAVAGVARPTTAKVSAAVWGDSAQALLDWIGVEPRRRLARAIDELDDPDEGELRGMVLLDLPDHDSINADNRAVVDRVVPMADLLLWVVDPQKYADHALHSAYLEAASRLATPSLVVLNQIDRLATEDAWAVARDLQRLLAADGMTQVPVMPVSARTGQGMEVLRAELGGAVAARSVAAEAVRADLVAAGHALAGALAAGVDPQVPDSAELVAALARAAGVEAHAEAAAATARGSDVSVRHPLEVPVAAVERERWYWADAATEGLPTRWREVVANAIVDAPTLAAQINSALAEASWPTPESPRGWNGLFAKAARAATARKRTMEVAHSTINAVVVPGIVDRTVTIHQAYRALEELTVWDAAPAKEDA